ncbi:MAG TPA: hypothetical protein VJP85_13495 [Candidatus Baltobacteraceae bacterium]|nr:hypothetical protein [Candidatus Baltobacteraceae bacterium]
MKAGTDRDLNLTRISFFVIGLVVGALITFMLFTRPQASFRKLYFNDCGRYANEVSRCGHGSPDLNPND